MAFVRAQHGRGMALVEDQDAVEDLAADASMQEAQIPEPTITEFEVHKLDWVRG